MRALLSLFFVTAKVKRCASPLSKFPLGTLIGTAFLFF